jgi:hypothetical protein
VLFFYYILGLFWVQMSKKGKQKSKGDNCNVRFG